MEWADPQPRARFDFPWTDAFCLGLRLVASPFVRRLISGRDTTNDQIGNETRAAGELRRQHFRSPKGAEVDIVAEDRTGRIVGIEVKASVGIDERAFRGLRCLQERHPDRFIAGYVLYCGTETVPVGAGLHAVPIPALWAG